MVRFLGVIAHGQQTLSQERCDDSPKSEGSSIDSRSISSMISNPSAKRRGRPRKDSTLKDVQQIPAESGLVDTKRSKRCSKPPLRYSTDFCTPTTDEKIKCDIKGSKEVVESELKRGDDNLETPAIEKELAEEVGLNNSIYLKYFEEAFVLYNILCCVICNP